MYSRGVHDQVRECAEECALAAPPPQILSMQPTDLGYVHLALKLRSFGPGMQNALPTFSLSWIRMRVKIVAVALQGGTDLV